jgi:hypothetical protein
VVIVKHKIKNIIEVIMRSYKLLILPGLLMILSGCNIKQNIQPASTLKTKEICIVNNPPVRAGFLTAYTQELHKKGYKTKLLAANSPLSSCKVVSTYTGLWSWDMALYLAYADIKVYQNSQLVGSAVYDSRSGGGNMSKFIRGEEKIEELANQLFP